MEFIWSFKALECGSSGTGLSALIIKEKISFYNSEHSIQSMFLLNCGDSTQRFCMANKVKLSKTQYLHITSISPHNIAGIPGLILSLSDLGIASLTISGPYGLRALVEKMSTFVNRRYPEIHIVEVGGHLGNPTSTKITLEHSTVNLIAVQLANTDSVVSAACVIGAIGGVEEMTPTVACIPLAPFQTEPSTDHLIDWALSHKSQLITFFPTQAGVGSLEAPSMKRVVEKAAARTNSTTETITPWIGVVFDFNQLSSVAEFPRAQISLAVMRHLCSPLFPSPFSRLKRLLESAKTPPDGVYNGTKGDYSIRDGEENEECDNERCINDSRGIDDNDTREKTDLSKNIKENDDPSRDDSHLIRIKNDILKSCHKNAYSVPSSQYSVTNLRSGDVVSAISHLTITLLKLSSSSSLYLSDITRPLHPKADLTAEGENIPRPTAADLAETSCSSSDGSDGSDGFSDVGGKETGRDGWSSWIELMRASHKELSCSPSPFFSASVPNQLFTDLARRSLFEIGLIDRAVNEVVDTVYESRSSLISMASDTRTTDIHRTGRHDATLDKEDLMSRCLPCEEDVTRDINVNENDDVDVSVTNRVVAEQLRRSLSGVRKRKYVYESGQENLKAIIISDSTNATIDGNCDGNSGGEKELYEIDVRRAIKEPPMMPPPHPMDPSLTFLGTGSAAPSKYRCNSSIMFQLPSQSTSRDCILLLDVGEGTVSQLYHSVCGDEMRMKSRLQAIRMVWISHHHADHHCGLIMLLEMRIKYKYRYPDPIESELWNYKIVVIAPENVIDYHQYCCRVSGLDDDIIFIEHHQFNKSWNRSKILEATDGTVAYMKSIPVYHCKDAFGLVFQLTDRNMKIVYSGDCRPTPLLVKEGNNCDILIHEATFDDSRQDDAIKKKHSTTSEAWDMGRSMQAKHIILTHFSQRYPRAPTSVQEIVGYELMMRSYPISFAFDFLNVHFPSQLNFLHKCTEYIVSVLHMISENRDQL